MNNNSPAFELLQCRTIESLNIEYQEYQHRDTAARHIHLAADNRENVFMVALRTAPEDSTGVAHILEHTSLCGSKKFPVRDPFFMMIRRSLNTFMNAFTSADWTAYPFASENKKDFDNLLEVYLDAVFFARLDPLDFAQEGHRLEFSEADNADSPLLYKGVVFNEMKGAMSAISSQLWQAVGEGLFPDTTYGVNSGGDPEDIPQLSYQQLQDFYHCHYHPDNAVFITFGDTPAAAHQEKFQALALRHFSASEAAIEVPEQEKFNAVKRRVSSYPLPAEDYSENKTHHVMAWIVGDIRDPQTLMAAHLLSSALLENSAAPLQQALETSELGTAPSPLCGLDDSGLEMVFVCGLEGCREDDRAAFESLIEDTLQQVTANGIAEQRMTALLDRLELQQREIRGDSYPYGLQLMLSCLPSAMHRSDAAAALDISPVLQGLRQSIKDPDYIKSLVQTLLLDNHHRVTVSLRPDCELNQRRINTEQEKLAAIKAALSKEEAQGIIDTAAALKQRQLQTDDAELLPKVGLEDIPAEQPAPAYSEQTVAKQPLALYPQPTNGIVYQQIVTALPELSERQHFLLSLHNSTMTELGVGERDYLAAQNWQSQVCGGISAHSSLRATLSDEQAISGHFTLSAKGLNAHSDAIAALLQESHHRVRFDELQRLRELIAQSRARAEQSITGSGHTLAMAIACQGMSPIAKLHHSGHGTLGIQRLKQLDEALDSPQKLTQLAEDLAEIQNKITANRQRFLVVGDSAQTVQTAGTLQSLWKENPASTESHLTAEICRKPQRELWLCNTQINFCAKAYPTVTAAHPDAAALTVLAGVLRNGFLHTAIREQGGAYGGGASQDSGIAAFRFYSYRDPRLGDTLDDFDRSVDWLLSTDHPWRSVEEAILGVIGALDKPSSPAGNAKKHFHDQLYGRTQEQHRQFRQAVLSVTEADLKRVAAQYLKAENASIGIVSHNGEAANYGELCRRLEIDIRQL